MKMAVLVALVFGLCLIGSANATTWVKEIPLSSATLYDWPAHQYRLTEAQSFSLQTWGPHIDMYGQPLRNYLTIHDLMDMVFLEHAYGNSLRDDLTINEIRTNTRNLLVDNYNHRNFTEQYDQKYWKNL